MNCFQAMTERVHPIGERRQFANVNNLSKKVCNDFQVSITRTSSTRTCTNGSTVCRCFDLQAPDGEEDDAVNNHDGIDGGNDDDDNNDDDDDQIHIKLPRSALAGVG